MTKKTTLFFGLMITFFMAQANTLIVTNTNNTGAGSFRQASADALSGDTIRFDPNLISGGSATIVLNGHIGLANKELVVKGLYNATDTLFISGNNTNRLYHMGTGFTQDVTLDSLVFINGGGGHGAFVFYQGSGSLYVKNSIVRNSSSTQHAGAIAMISGDTLFVENSDFKNCTAVGVGGVVWILNSNVKINNSNFSNSSAGSVGGAIEIEDGTNTKTLEIYNSSFDNMTANNNGGVIFGWADMIIKSTSFTNNSAVNNGGVIFGNYSNFMLTVDSCNFENNAATNLRGGAIYFTSNPSNKISNSTFTSNSCGAQGSALYIGRVMIENSTFNNNTGDATIFATALTELLNSTIVNNTGGPNFGAIRGGANIINSTITGNTSTGGTSAIDGGVTVQSSIIAFNTGAPQLSTGSINSLGNNVFDFPFITGGQSSDVFGATSGDVNLGTLQNNGGFTETMMPNYPSILINNGNPSDPSDAQNRPIRLTRDIGAAESCASFDVSNIQACDSYTWSDGDGNTYTNTTIEEHLLSVPNQEGCDSVLIMNLLIEPSPADQSVSITDNFFCNSGSTTVDIASSETGMKYWLRDDANDTIVDGPLEGNGSGLTFNTSSVSQTMTYNVVGELGSSEYGLDFDASSNDRIEFHSPSTNFTDEITVEAWIKFDNGQVNIPWMGQSIMGVDDQSSNSWVWHEVGGNAFRFYVNDNGNWVYASSTSLAGLDGWHHISTVADASGTYIYIDGILNSSGPGVTSNIVMDPNSAVTIGGDSRFPNTGARHGTYQVSEVQIWNLAKTPTEVFNNMNTCYAGNESGLEFYCKMNEGVGTTVPAITGNDGVLSSNMDPITDWVQGHDGCDGAAGNCSTEMSQVVTLTIGHTNTAAITTSACDSYTVPSGDETYTLSGIYMDTIPNVSGCDSVMTIDVTVNTSHSTTDVLEACGRYTWIDGVEYTSSNNTATHLLQSTTGCDSLVTLDLIVHDTLILSAVVTEETMGNDGAIDLTVNGGTPTYLFDWDNDGTGDQDDSEDLQNLTAGNYTVIVVDDNGCSATLTETVNSTVSLSSDELDNVSLYPNPTNGEFYIQLNDNREEVQVQILDLSGKMIYNSIYSGKNLIHINEELSAGTYIINLIIDGEAHKLFLVQQ